MSDSETPMYSIICPVCAKMAKLKTYAQPGDRRVPRALPAALEALYHCEGSHEIRMTVTRLPDFGSAAQ